MDITVIYNVDMQFYHTPDAPHQITLTTTEYSYMSDVLVHLQVGRNLSMKLNNLIYYEFKKGTILPNDIFMFKKKYSKNKPKSISNSEFERKILRFDLTQTSIEQEIVEKYDYTDKVGNFDAVQVVTTIKDGKASAVIEFRNGEQHENFIQPTWFIRQD